MPHASHTSILTLVSLSNSASFRMFASHKSGLGLFCFVVVFFCFSLVPVIPRVSCPTPKVSEKMNSGSPTNIGGDP